ncbi:MAG: 50S ribosomal protein L6 [Promethearchaeota archaeon]
MGKIAFFREELEIPDDVDIKLEGNKITIKGPQGGPITKDFNHARGIKIMKEGQKLIFSTDFPKSGTLALIKTIINIVNNLILGVQENYKYVCMICYSHFPCNVRVDEKNKIIYIENFLGEKAPRKTKISPNVKIEVKNDEVYLIGPDKETLGQTAANIKKACKIKKKDPRVFQDGVYLYKKMRGDEVIWQIK